MRIDVLGLQAFVSIAERGSFHGAASHLNLSQTALSHRIRKLESLVGTRLLLRTTRQVKLTPAGAALLPSVRKLFDDLGTAVSELQLDAASREERIAIGCLPTAAMHVLPSVIAEFTRSHPGIHVKIFDNSTREIAERVQAGEAAFGVTIVSANRWDLDLKPVVREPFVFLCHRSMPFAANSSLSWAQIQNVPLVRISAETGNRILIDDALGTRRESLSWRYEVQRVATAVSLVRSGLCAAIVPQLAIDLAENDEIVAISLTAPTVSRMLGIIRAKGAPLPPPTEDLLKLVTLSLKARLSRRRSPSIAEHCS
ncbi:LysR Transcriptional regulator [Rhabdaerophilaceae bacterium]